MHKWLSFLEIKSDILDKGKELKPMVRFVLNLAKELNI